MLGTNLACAIIIVHCFCAWVPRIFPCCGSSFVGKGVRRLCADCYHALLSGGIICSEHFQTSNSIGAQVEDWRILASKEGRGMAYEYLLEVHSDDFISLPTPLPNLGTSVTGIHDVFPGNEGVSVESNWHQTTSIVKGGGWVAIGEGAKTLRKRHFSCASQWRRSLGMSGYWRMSDKKTRYLLGWRSL